MTMNILGMKAFVSLGTIVAMSLVPLKTVHTDVRWYGKEAPSDQTSNGEIFDADWGFTYASNLDDYNTLIRITYNGHTVQCRCNDRGPNRVELNEFAFKQLADPSVGVLRNAQIDYLNAK